MLIATKEVGSDSHRESSSRTLELMYLSNSEQIGGGNRSLLTLATGMTSQGHHPRVICPKRGPMSDRCESLKIEHYVRPYVQPTWRSPWETYGEFKTWTQLLDSQSVDLIHANDCSNARVVSLAAWRRNIPLVCHIRFAPKPAAIEWMFRRMPLPNVLVFNSHALQEEVGPEFQRCYPGLAQTVIHNAVRTDEFYPTPRITEDCIRIGMIANLLPIKGHVDFLKMARQIYDHHKNCEFVVIGGDIHSSGYGQHLLTRTQELGLSDVVRFLGHCPNVPELVNQLDIVVCPSHVEPFGLCLLEGMACEKPIVATRVGGIPEVVDDGVTGILVAPRMAEELTAAVEALVLDPALRSAMGQAGRDRVLRLFTPECVIQRTASLYERLIHG